MTFLKEYKSVKDRVKWALIKYPQTRDEDKFMWRVIAGVFYDFRNRIEACKTGKDAFAEMLRLMDDMPSFESIRRSRQKLQEQNEHLRGKSYRNRQGHSEEVREHMVIGKGGTP